MNCNEYRQALTADPAFTGGVEHAAVCADCRAFTRKVEALLVYLRDKVAWQGGTP